MSAELLATELRTPGVAALFAVVYLGMFLGDLPRLKPDATGVALRSVNAMIARAVMLLLTLAGSCTGDIPLVGRLVERVVGLKEKSGISIDWKLQARIGLPVAGQSLAFLWLCWSFFGTGASATAASAP